MKNTYHKDDLIFKNRYNWNNESKHEAKPVQLFGSTVFNRHQGCHVIFLINQLMNKKALVNMKLAQKIETMLISLPNEKQTFRQVSNWVIYNWNIKLQLPRNKVYSPEVHNDTISSKQAMKMPVLSD